MREKSIIIFTLSLETQNTQMPVLERATVTFQDTNDDDDDWGMQFFMTKKTPYMCNNLINGFAK